MSLKDHRLNHLQDCALAMLYHLDDISGYLREYQTINNGMLILDRRFMEIKNLKSVYAAISLLGIIKSSVIFVVYYFGTLKTE